MDQHQRGIRIETFAPSTMIVFKKNGQIVYEYESNYLYDPKGGADGQGSYKNIGGMDERIMAKIGQKVETMASTAFSNVGVRFVKEPRLRLLIDTGPRGKGSYLEFNAEPDGSIGYEKGELIVERS